MINIIKNDWFIDCKMWSITECDLSGGIFGDNNCHLHCRYRLLIDMGAFFFVIVSNQYYLCYMPMQNGDECINY